MLKKVLKKASIKSLEYSLVLLLLGGVASLLFAHGYKKKSLIIFGDSGLIIRASSKIVNNGATTLTGAITTGGDIISDTDGTDDIGSTAIRYDQGYFDELFWNKGADVASATNAFTLGEDGNYYDITGTAALDSITAQTVGKVVALQFDGILTMTDGGNLKLHGNFVTAAGATIFLQSDGTDWYELSRAGGNYIVQGALTVDGVSTLTGAQTLTGVTTHSGNVISDTDGTDDLGTSSVRWNALFVDEVFGQKGADVASAATDFTLGADGWLYDITGTTGIDSIKSQTVGKIVFLQFDSTPTVTDGGNLKLAGNFVATAGDILSLICDGTDWFEISRSAN